MTTRDPMAPDTEPTDEELAAVMDAARELAIQRRTISDAWVAARLGEAAHFAREHRRQHESLTAVELLDPADDVLYDPEDDLAPLEPERQGEDQREVS